MKTLMCDPKLFEKRPDRSCLHRHRANSGAGYATSAQLVRQGAHVVGGCRRVEAGKEAFAALESERGSADVIALWLASLDSVRSFAEAFTAKYDRLDGLVKMQASWRVLKGERKMV